MTYWEGSRLLVKERIKKLCFNNIYSRSCFRDLRLMALPLPVASQPAYSWTCPPFLRGVNWKILTTTNEIFLLLCLLLLDLSKWNWAANKMKKSRCIVRQHCVDKIRRLYSIVNWIWRHYIPSFSLNWWIWCVVSLLFEDLKDLSLCELCRI